MANKTEYIPHRLLIFERKVPKQHSKDPYGSRTHLLMAQSQREESTGNQLLIGQYSGNGCDSETQADTIVLRQNTITNESNSYSIL